jgi:hypothetical protein
MDLILGAIRTRLYINPCSPVGERLKNKHALVKFGITTINAIIERVFPIFSGLTL